MFGLRARMAITAMAATAAALLAVLLLVGPAVRERSLAESRETLLAEAALVARLVEGPLAAGMDPAALDRLVDEATRDSEGRRITIVDPAGRVLADSAVSGADLLALENHAGRPEIREAVAAGRGSVVRRSTTVSDELLYAAVGIRGHRGVIGVARVARPVRRIDEDVAELRRAITYALALAFGITAVLSLALSSSLAGPLREIMDSARRFAAGELGARSHVERGDELGELARILNNSADQLQARLTDIARERARLDAILSAMEEGLLAVDRQGTVLLANESLSRALGLREPVGRHYLEAVRHSEVAALVEEVLRTGERRETDVILHHVRRAFTLAGGPFPGVEGAPHGAVVTFHDVTDRRRVEQIRRDFVANASHELRTPLTSIRGFVEALEDGAREDPKLSVRFLGKIRTHADAMASLLTDLLELSRLDAGAERARLGAVDLGDVARRAALSMEGAESREASIAVEVEGSPVATADPERLRRILVSLLDNAVKYGGSRIVMRVSAAANGGGTIEVIDDGPGIPPEHLPRIFERFYRVDAARAREVEGTGLGLSIVRHLADSMGATVSVTSRPGATVFTVGLPARDGPPPVSAPGPENAAGTARGDQSPVTSERAQLRRPVVG